MSAWIDKNLTAIVAVMLACVAGILFGASTQYETDKRADDAQVGVAEQKILLAVDRVQYAAWEVTDQAPTDGMIDWYTSLMRELSDIECGISRQECE